MSEEPAHGTDGRSPVGTESVDPPARYQRSTVPRLRGTEHRIRMETVDVARLLIALDTFVPLRPEWGKEVTDDERREDADRWHPWRELRAKLRYGPERFTMDRRNSGHPTLDELIDQECAATGRERPEPKWR